MKRCGILFLMSALFFVAAPTSADNEICRVTTVDGTVENGVGAEPGVSREFVQDLDVPPECQTQGGNTWVLAHELSVTRIEPSSATVNAQVTVRRLDLVRGIQPKQILIESHFVAVDTSTFPQMGSEWTIFGGPPRAAPALGLGPSVVLDGDLTGNQFVTVDQSAGTPLRTCWTRNGLPEWELCTNGNPAIRGIGLTLRVSPFVADFPQLGRTPMIVSNLPDGSSTITLDFSGIDAASDLLEDVELREPGNPIPICSSPADFPLLCPLTAAQMALHRQSQLMIIVTPRIVPPEGIADPIASQLISADHYVFSNGFESGDGSFWSTVVP